MNPISSMHYLKGGEIGTQKRRERERDGHREREREKLNEWHVAEVEKRKREREKEKDLQVVVLINFLIYSRHLLVHLLFQSRESTVRLLRVRHKLLCYTLYFIFHGIDVYPHRIQ